MSAVSALYFPYNDISPAALARALRFFNRIIIYRLPLGQPGDELAAAAASGRVELVETGFIEDRNELRAILADFSRLAESYGDPESINALRQYLESEDAEKSGARLMSEIKHYSREAAADAGRDRQAQIFLHFAEHLDRQTGEIDQLFVNTLEKESRLGDVMGVEWDEDDEDALAQGLTPPPKETAPSAGSRSQMLPGRIKAWARLHQAFGRSEQALFTDNSDAVAALDLMLSKKVKTGKQGAGRPFEILEPAASYFVPAEGNAQPPEDWAGFLNGLAEKTWHASDLENLRAEAAGFPSQNGPGAVVTAYLLPGRDLKTAMAGAAGLVPWEDPGDAWCGPLLEIRVAD